MSYIKFDCLNIDKDVVITNDVNDNGPSDNKKSDQDLIKIYRPKDLKL